LTSQKQGSIAIRFTAVGLAVLGATLATQAVAQTAPGWYIGGNVGRASADFDAPAPVVPPGIGYSEEDHDTAWKLYGGYQFTRLASIELGYTDFGSVGLSSGSVATGSYSATAFSVAGVATLPLAPKLSGIAKLGLASVDADYSYSGPFGLFASSASESSIEPYVSFGLAYALTPQLTLTGSLDYTRADYPRGSGSATLLAIGLKYAF